MVRLVIALFVVWGLSAPLAEAGAWPRKAGEGFASAAVRLGWPQNLVARARSGEAITLDPTSRYVTLYAEYGLTDRVTAGLDVGHAVSGAGKSIFFLSHPLGIGGDGPHRFAAALGLGRIDDAFVVRPGLSYGYGFSGDRWSGWFAVDAVAEHFTTRGNTDVKVDMTFGLNLDRGRRAIVQVQAGKQVGDDTFVRLAPSYVVPWGETRNIEMGVTVSLAGEADVGVLLGIWQSF